VAITLGADVSVARLIEADNGKCGELRWTKTVKYPTILQRPPTTATRIRKERAHYRAK